MTISSQQNRPFYAIILGVLSSTALTQFLGILRHLVIASAFGVERDMDLYATVNAAALNIVFIFSTIFDTVSVPLLSTLYARQELKQFSITSSRFFSFSIVFSLIISTIFILSIPALQPIIAAGMNAPEHIRMREIRWYFLPWTLTCIPYYTITSIHKSKWHFKRIFSAEILIISVSMVTLLVWHDDVTTIPISYGIGYAFGLIWLIPKSGLKLVLPLSTSDGIKNIYRNMGEMFGAAQISNVGSFIEKFLQSHLQAGSISAYGYSTLLVNNISSILNFREIFIVPLSDPNMREAKLERILICLTLIAWPIMGGVFLEASSIITILFQRGKFDQQAVDLCNTVLKIYIVALWPGMLCPPMARLFQILDKIKMTAYYSAVSTIVTLLMGGVMVLWLGYGLRGYVITMVAASYANLLTIIFLLYLVNIRVSWRRFGRYTFFAIGLTATAYILAAQSMEVTRPYFLNMIISSALYGLIVSIGYLPLKKQIFLLLGR